jgi:hypothetical protein
MQDLARILFNTSHNNEDYQVLECIGYLKDSNARQDLVFLRPPTLRTESLLEMLQASENLFDGPHLKDSF